MQCIELTAKEIKMTSQNTTSNTENVYWNLDVLYKSINDPQIKEDIDTCKNMMKSFFAFKGKLKTTLAEALALYVDIEKLQNKLGVYSYLVYSTHVDNDEAVKLMGVVEQELSMAGAECMNFFDHEIVALTEADYQSLLNTAEIITHHKPMLDDIRHNAKHMLSEDVEQALSMRSPFNGGEWGELCDEMENELVFTIGGEEKTFIEALEILSESDDAAVRYEALKVVNKELGVQYTRFRARSLNVVMGLKGVSDKQRGFAKPISERNFDSKLTDETVDALHEAVGTLGAEECQRFYKLKFALMGKDGSAQPWSERNAKVPFASKEKVSWEDTKKIVIDAYASFSPTLAGLVEGIIDNDWIDVHPYKGKNDGAYDYTAAFPEGNYSFNFLNHQGSIRDVMTAAHELGHGVHGLLSCEAQGPLMSDAPMVYAETASIFGEMITFQHMLTEVKSDEERLALLISKTDDFMNSVVRQVSFSVFEQNIHDKRKNGKLSVSDYNEAWLEATAQFYGADGTLFKHDDMENLWSYVGHFMRPFYVYAYAFGELFTQSLFATKDTHGESFEPMYLDLLRKGGTEGAVDLMKPFGLNPNDPDFWTGGIKCSATKWIDEAEVLAKRLGYIK